MYVYITIIIYSIRTYKQYNSIIMLYKYSILYSQFIYAVERRVKQRQVWMGELGVVRLRCSVDSLEDVQRQGQHQPREKQAERKETRKHFDIKLNQEHKKYSYGWFRLLGKARRHRISKEIDKCFFRELAEGGAHAFQRRRTGVDVTHKKLT